jgi:hypothetical protein
MPARDQQDGDQPSTLYFLNQGLHLAPGIVGGFLAIAGAVVGMAAMRRESALQKETRPSAQYAANDLASPDIEIGSRHPVNCMLPRNCTKRCEPAHIR